MNIKCDDRFLFGQTLNNEEGRAAAAVAATRKLLELSSFLRHIQFANNGLNVMNILYSNFPPAYSSLLSRGKHLGWL